MKRFTGIALIWLLLGRISYADTTFVAGVVAGDWTAEDSPYIVQSALTIATGTTLSIGPGVRVYFEGPYDLLLDSGATLRALGNESDSIVFTGRADFDAIRWGGIASFHQSDTLRFAYSIVENAQGLDGRSALSCANSDLVVERSTFRENVGHDQRDVHGAALSVWDNDYPYTLTTHIRDCLFEDNRANHGGAVSLYSVGGEMERCVFRSNRAAAGGALYSMVAPVTIRDCEFTDNHVTGNYSLGGAIWFEMNAGEVVNCLFENNSAEMAGGAIADSWGGPYPDGGLYDGCTFHNNTSDSLGGAMSVDGVSVVRRCVFTANSAETGGALNVRLDDAITITQCTFVGNDATEMASAINREYESGSYLLRLVNCVFAQNTGAPAFRDPQCIGNLWRYNCFWENDSLYRRDLCSSNHEIDYLNANGDSCDWFYNLYFDPMFVDPANGDYRLQAGSPLIDAGVAGNIFETENDPDGTAPDIGAIYFHQTPEATEEIAPLPEAMTLSQNYPNPFNAETTIAFEVPQAMHARLELFDVTGRMVRVLYDNVISGPVTVPVALDGVASGVYVYRLSAAHERISRKMLLLK